MSFVLVARAVDIMNCVLVYLLSLYVTLTLEKNLVFISVLNAKQG